MISSYLIKRLVDRRQVLTSATINLYQIQRVLAEIAAGAIGNTRVSAMIVEQQVFVRQIEGHV